MPATSSLLHQPSGLEVDERAVTSEAFADGAGEDLGSGDCARLPRAGGGNEDGELGN